MVFGRTKSMNCSDLQLNLSLYTDDMLDGAQTASFEQHLAVCPLCRARVSNTVSIKNELRSLSRPEIPVIISERVRRAVRDEIRGGRAPYIASPAREWLQMRLMPFAVGLLATVVVGFSFLSMLFNGGLVTGSSETAASVPDNRVLIAANRGPLRGDASDDISPADYARTRLAVAGESPSINPQGALISLSRSLVQGGMKNNEVVVVADVFSNGLARIAEVVEPSQNDRAVDELQKALVSDPSNAPFVTADMDKRSENVRVVLKFQSVEVNTRKLRK